MTQANPTPWLEPDRDGTGIPVPCSDQYAHGQHPAKLAYAGEWFLCPGNDDGHVSPHQMAHELHRGQS